MKEYTSIEELISNLKKQIAEEMNHIFWKISRYWNRVAFFIMDFGRRMIWDQSGLNQEVLPEVIDGTTKAIMCDYD